jgi:hypothetical protein
MRPVDTGNGRFHQVKSEIYQIRHGRQGMEVKAQGSKLKGDLEVNHGAEQVGETELYSRETREVLYTWIWQVSRDRE